VIPMAKRATGEAIDLSNLYETEERAMSDADRKQVGDELADVEQTIRAVEEEKKNVNTNYRVRIRKLKERADVLSRQWKDGAIEVSFEVTETHDDETMMVHVERKDSGKRISSRPMTEPEKEAARKRKQGKLSGIVDDDYEPADTNPGTPKAKRAKSKGSKR